MAEQTKEVRILVDYGKHRCNAVVKLPNSVVEALKEQGIIDDHPDAIAYAKSLAKGKAPTDDSVNED